MAEFLTLNGISFYIENIIKESKSELLILFPYLQLSHEFYEALKDSSERGTPISIVYVNEDLRTEEKLMLGDLQNLEIYHSENLGAKCCCNEDNVLITSMDIHKYTPSESLEMGVLFNKTQDSDLYKKTYNEIKSIINSSKNMNLHKRPVEELVEPRIKVKKIYHGFCINCAMPISYSMNNPYCRMCSKKSDIISDSGKRGNYCHLCGTSTSTTSGSPICDVCKAENL